MALGLAVTRNGTVLFAAAEHSNETQVETLLQRAAKQWGFSGDPLVKADVVAYVLAQLEQAILDAAHGRKLAEQLAVAKEGFDG